MSALVVVLIVVAVVVHVVVAVAAGEIYRSTVRHIEEDTEDIGPLDATVRRPRT